MTYLRMHMVRINPVTGIQYPVLREHFGNEPMIELRCAGAGWRWHDFQGNEWNTGIGTEGPIWRRAEHPITTEQLLLTIEGLAAQLGCVVSLLPESVIAVKQTSEAHANAALSLVESLRFLKKRAKE